MLETWFYSKLKFLKRLVFSTVSDFAIFPASKFTQNDIFCRYFANILTGSAEQLLFHGYFMVISWLLLDGYFRKYESENFEICMCLLCFSSLIFNWCWRNKKSRNSTSVIEKNDKERSWFNWSFKTIKTTKIAAVRCATKVPHDFSYEWNNFYYLLLRKLKQI